MQGGEFVIDVHDLTKRFGELIAVNALTLQVERGEIYGFLGPNGSGKTTAIRMLCGLLKPSAGSGTCLGYDILTQSSEIKRQVGYMTQRFSLYEESQCRRESGLCGAPVRGSGPPPGRGCEPGTARFGGSPAAARGELVRGLETAAGARCMSPASAATAAIG